MSRFTRQRSFVITVATVGVLAAVLTGDDRPPAQTPPAAGAEITPAEHDKWMRLKAVSAREIFDGLVEGNLTAVEQNARRMQVFNVLEQWLKRREFAQSSAYQGELNAFEFSVRELIRHGKDKNTAGCLDAYVAMTRSCVRCHDLLRAAPSN